MDKFEMLLNDLTAKHSMSKELPPKDPKPTPKFNSLGSRIGEQREIVIRYAVGKEEDAKVYEGTSGKDGMKEDSLALLNAAGKLIGDAAGIDGKQISSDLVKTAMKSLLGNALSTLFKELEGLLDG